MFKNLPQGVRQSRIFYLWNFDGVFLDFLNLDRVLLDDIVGLWDAHFNFVWYLIKRKTFSKSSIMRKLKPKLFIHMRCLPILCNRLLT